MWYLDSNNKPIQVTDPYKIKLYGYIAELHLYINENPMNTEAGIDYPSILELSKYIITELENNADKWRPYFNSIDIGDVEYSNNNTTMAVPITIVEKDLAKTTIRLQL